MMPRTEIYNISKHPHHHDDKDTSYMEGLENFTNTPFWTIAKYNQTCITYREWSYGDFKHYPI